RLELFPPCLGHGAPRLHLFVDHSFPSPFYPPRSPGQDRHGPQSLPASPDPHTRQDTSGRLLPAAAAAQTDHPPRAPLQRYRRRGRRRGKNASRPAGEPAGGPPGGGAPPRRGPPAAPPAAPAPLPRPATVTPPGVCNSQPPHPLRGSPESRHEIAPFLARGRS